LLVYIGLGSNLNNPKQQIKQALITLASYDDVKILKVSSLYKSKPIDLSDQPDYINAVCAIKTNLSALKILSLCNFIEDKQLRVRAKKWGARNIDLDIILYGNEVINSEKLIVPHQQMIHRAFVLVPLLEIADNLKIPIFGYLIDLIVKIDTSQLIKL
jgi:2-amino-4-hydroxy-6-hydroxymethyldihydropteridine diphosphokinase